MKIILLLLRR